MNRAPAFMFYAADFKTNTAELSHEERGVYIDLLCHAWINDGLPVEEDRLYRLIGGERAPELWASIRHLWERTDVQRSFNGRSSERWVNPRMEAEREKQAERRRKASEAGKASGRARSTNERSTDVRTDVPTNVASKFELGANISIESENRKVVELRKEESPLDELLFALRDLWPPERNFPSDHNRQEEAIFEADRKGELPDDLIESARLYLDAHGFTAGSVEGCPNISTWISDRRWLAPLPTKSQSAGDFTSSGERIDWDAYDVGGAA